MLDPANWMVSQPHCHYIRTVHGTYLLADRISGLVQHGSEIDERALPLLYFELEPTSRYGFLTPAGELDRFVCGGDTSLGSILPVRKIEISARAIALQHVVRGTFLSAWIDEHSPSCVVYRDEALAWERFSLHRVRWELPQQRSALAAAFESLLVEPPSVETGAAAILSAREIEQDALLALCFDLLTIDEFVALLDTIRAQILGPPPGDGLLKRVLDLRAASASDIPSVPGSLLQPPNAESEFWVGRILSDLMAWRRDRNRALDPGQHIRLGPDLDFLHCLENGISLGSSGRLYNFLTRYTTQPTRDICVVATARNEGVYLLEWIAYHKSIGIETFFIYSNDNDDGSNALLKRLSDAGVITLVENVLDGDTPPQQKAFNHALNVLPHILDYKWAIFIDIDEFLVVDPNRFAALSDYITWQEKQTIDAIAFSWIIMTSWGQNKWSPEFVRQRFTRRRTHPDKHIKSMFRPQKFLHCQPHYPLTDWRVPVSIRDSSGSPHLNYYGSNEPSFMIHPKAEAAWINHYYFKSAEEFVWQRWRGAGNHKVGPELLTASWLRGFADQATDQIIHDERILQCSKRFQECYDSLLKISGVPEILKRIENNFREILKNIITELLIDPTFDHTDDLLAAFFGCLMEPGGLCVPDDFDANLYLSTHEDVAESGVTPALHYLRHGRGERQPRR
jgi:hypothetical protein